MRRSLVNPMLVLLALLWSGPAGAQLDVCGCAGHPESGGDFDSRDPTTYPPGTTEGSRQLTLPLPESGVLVFDSLVLQPRPADGGSLTVTFSSPFGNPPVTLLVAGDVVIGDDVTVRVEGARGENGTVGMNGRGGAPGPGGYRGGDGAYQDVNGAADGGPGLGPGGGRPGRAEGLTAGEAGVYGGTRELSPLIGGAGGGGGASSDTGNCSAGGGGGGGGAILVAADGTITVDGTVDADGGRGGNRSSSACATPGGPGSGGAIRLVATTIEGGGQLRARGNDGAFGGEPGVVRIEALADTFADSIPPAVRSAVLAPLVNPLAPSVAITAVMGEAVPAVLTGSTGGIDMVVSAPGPVDFQLDTSGVPSGTAVDLRVKPKVGGGETVHTVTLEPAACDPAGACTAFATVDLARGAYFVEALATFEVP